MVLQIAGVATIIDGGALYLKRLMGTSMGGCLNSPGGKQVGGESPVQNAARELREETGIIAREEDLRWMCEFDSYALSRKGEKIPLRAHSFLLVARNTSLDSVRLLPEEHEGKVVLTLEQLRKLRGSSATRYIENYDYDPDEIVFTPPDAKFLREHFWVLEKGFAELSRE